MSEFSTFEDFDYLASTLDFDKMNLDIYKLFDHLPVLYKVKDENEYIQTLFKALSISYTNALYQFAYLQLHMIFMVCIYYILLKINIVEPRKITDALYYMIKDKSRLKDFYGEGNTRDYDLYFGSFAVLGESDVFLLLKIVEIDPDLQGELKKLVEERNKYAHANGNITITSQEIIDEKISKYINCLDRVENLIIALYKQNLTNPDFSDPEERLGYFDNNEQIKEELVRKYYFTKKEINFCRKIDLSEISANDNFDEIKNIHIELCKYYKEITDTEDDTPINC